MRKRFRIMLSVAFGLLAVLLGFAYGEQIRAEVEAERSEALERYGGEVVELVVAKSELVSGEILSENNIETREWLVDLAPEGSISEISEVLGLRLTTPVAKGEPLNALDIATQEGSLEIPEGRVAISVHLSDKTGLAQEVSNGARVLCYRSVDAGLRAICSDAVVLVAASMGSSSTFSSGTESICLAVLPEYVEDVLAASSDGSLRLALPGEGVSAGAYEAPTTVEAQDAEAQDTGAQNAEVTTQDAEVSAGSEAPAEEVIPNE